MKQITTKGITRPESIQDYTPFELWEIDQFQNRNRGFRDEEDEELENYNDWED